MQLVCHTVDSVKTAFPTCSGRGLDVMALDMHELTVSDLLAHAFDEPDGPFGPGDVFVAFAFALETELQVASPFAQSHLGHAFFAGGVVIHSG